MKSSPGSFLYTFLYRTSFVTFLTSVFCQEKTWHQNRHFTGTFRNEKQHIERDSSFVEKNGTFQIRNFLTVKQKFQTYLKNCEIWNTKVIMVYKHSKILYFQKESWGKNFLKLEKMMETKSTTIKTKGNSVNRYL